MNQKKKKGKEKEKKEESVSKKKQKVGRPRKKRLFRETAVGSLIQHMTPLIYKLIINACATNKPSPDFIEAMAYVSEEGLFHKQKFWMALRAYRKYGLYPPHPIKPSAKRELYYIKYRKNNNVISY